MSHDRFWVTRVAPHSELVSFCDEQEAPAIEPVAGFEVDRPLKRRWPQFAHSRVVPSKSAGAYVVDRMELPEGNPWRRAIRPGDLQFLPDGTGVVVTLAGMGRVRHTGAECSLPREVVAMAEGVLLRFDVVLNREKAVQAESYSVATWDYKRSHTYGPARCREDGSKGMDLLKPSSAYVSKDGRSVFIGVPGMRKAMQLRVGWTLASESGARVEENASTTPYELPKFDAAAEGFHPVVVDLTPRAAAGAASGPVSVEEGRRLSQVLGCVACHSTSEQDYFHVGRKWFGLFGSERPYVTASKEARGCARGRGLPARVHSRSACKDGESV